MASYFSRFRCVALSEVRRTFLPPGASHFPQCVAPSYPCHPRRCDPLQKVGRPPAPGASHFPQCVAPSYPCHPQKVRPTPESGTHPLLPVRCTFRSATHLLIRTTPEGATHSRKWDAPSPPVRRTFRSASHLLIRATPEGATHSRKWDAPSLKTKPHAPMKSRAVTESCPIADSNRCFGLERAVSWATRRMGPTEEDSSRVGAACQTLPDLKD